MGRTYKDKRKYLDKNNTEPKPIKPKYVKQKQLKKSLKDLLENEDFILGI